MASAIGLLPTRAWEFEGANKESERRESRRLTNRRALQELADKAAAEGRQLTVDDWAEMVHSTVGAEGMLYGYAPTAAAAEQIRQNQNLQAERVKQEQEFKRVQNERNEDKGTMEMVDDMIRSGTDDASIMAELTKVVGPERATRVASRIASSRGKMNQQDYTSGAQAGDSLMSDEEEKRILGTMTGASETFKQAFTQRARQKRDAAVRSVASEVAPLGYTPENEAYIKEQIRETLRSAAPGLDSETYVNQAMTIIKGRAAQQRAVGDAAIRQRAGETYAGAAPEIARVSTEFERVEQQNRDAAVKAATADWQRGEQARLKEMEIKYEPLLKSKDKKVAAAAGTAVNFLSNNDSDRADEIMAAANRGDHTEVERLIAESQRFGARPRSAISEGIRVRTEMANGGGYSNNTEMDFARLYGQGRDYDLRSIQARGEQLQKLAGINPQAAAESARQVSAGIASWLQANRAALGQGGRFGASAEQMRAMETAEVRKVLQPLLDMAARSGDNNFISIVSGIVNDVSGVVNSAPGFTARTGLQDIFKRAVERGGGAYNVPTPLGGPPPSQLWRPPY